MLSHVIFPLKTSHQNNVTDYKISPFARGCTRTFKVYKF